MAKLADLEHAVTDSIEYPAMRHDVITALEALFDHDHQLRSWTVRNAEMGTRDDFTMNLNILLDCGVIPDPERAVHWVLRESEVESFKYLGSLLIPLVDRLGDVPDEDYLEAPEWDSVVKASKAALAKMTT